MLRALIFQMYSKQIFKRIKMINDGITSSSINNVNMEAGKKMACYVVCFCAVKFVDIYEYCDIYNSSILLQLHKSRRNQYPNGKW